MNSMKLFGALLSVAALQACTPMSVSEIRAEPPGRSEIVSGEYSEVGMCVLDKLQQAEQSNWSAQLGNLMYENFTNPKASRMTVTGMIFVNGMKIPSIDVSFSGNGSTTLVETRPGGFQGGPKTGGEKFQALIWPVIFECAQPVKQ